MTSEVAQSEFIGTFDDLLAALDAAAREYLGISGEDFRTKWEAGEFVDDPNPDIMNVAILLPAS